jgi:uncharacterized protein
VTTTKTLGAMLLAPAFVHAAGLDCAKAVTPVEKAICARRRPRHSTANSAWRMAAVGFRRRTAAAVALTAVPAITSVR